MQQDSIQILHQKFGNFYSFLEIKTSNPKEIKKQYKILALKYHPDKQSGSNEKFLQLKQIYDILHKRKQEYDTFLEQIQHKENQNQQYSQLAKDLIQREKNAEIEKKKYAEELLKKRQKREEENQKEQEFLEKQRKIDEKMQKMAYQDNSEIYKKINSVIVDWVGIDMDYDENMLKMLFEGYGLIKEIIVMEGQQIASIQFMQTISADNVYQDFQQSNDLKVRFYIKQEKRQKLIKKIGLQKQNSKINLSLSTQNLNKISSIINQDSKHYSNLFDYEIKKQEERMKYMEEIIKNEVL